MEQEEFIKKSSILEVKKQYPQAQDFLENIGLQNLPEDLSLDEALLTVPEDDLAQFDLTRKSLPEQLIEFINTIRKIKGTCTQVKNLTIIGGENKNRQKEKITLTVKAGEIISIVGPTGSGKSCLLADVECLAQGDTPSKRCIMINGGRLSDEERFNLGNRLVAQLSQNMNFVMDVSVADFLSMHAKIRLVKDEQAVVKKCFDTANKLAGEKFSDDTKVTQLSGGQSRALMIADAAYISSSPIVLIDEIENAGVDRQEAIKCLARSEKIVILSTHDPLLALGADKRIVIKNGGMDKIITTTDTEKKCRNTIKHLDDTLLDIRNRLRRGELIENIDELRNNI
ncbi:ATP-binding cassette domain-containing protein [Pectinatus haikarae]|uniref:ATP-binding cassette domain-containing protein n=1 Tax=Pectinatus haikarae TaxID=349096 RepID=UPI0018C57996|nr:ATP-binding cassette domain-containing protein [Pectinatus haikarae]